MDGLIFPAMCITVVGIIALHTLVAFLRGTVSRILGYVNVGLHLLLFPLLLMLEAELELIALALVASLLVHLFVSYLASRSTRGKEKDGDI